MNSSYSSSIQYLVDRLNKYTYPLCSKHTNKDPLTMTCVDPRCEHESQLEPLCSVCTDNNSHKKQFHIQHNIRQILKELIYQCEIFPTTQADYTMNECEKKLSWLSKEFQRISEELYQISYSIQKSIEQYKVAQDSDHLVKNQVRKLIEEILEVESERTLRKNMQAIWSHCKVENEKVQLNYIGSQITKRNVEQNTLKYIERLQYTIHKMNELKIEDLVSLPSFHKDNSIKKTEFDIDNSISLDKRIKNKAELAIKESTLHDCNQIILDERQYISHTYVVLQVADRQYQEKSLYRSK